MNYLVVPGTGAQLTEGSIVILARYPGTKWILHNGWYTYDDSQFMGWYFASIPTNSILPLSDQDLYGIQIIGGGGCPCPPGPGPIPPGPIPPGPCPPGPTPPTPPVDPDPIVPYTEKQRDQLRAAFISVANLQERDAIDTSLIPDGKIVRVNSVDGIVKYYCWSSSQAEWVALGFGSNLSEYLTADQIAAGYVSKPDFATAQQELHDTITAETAESISVVQDEIDALDVRMIAAEDNILTAQSDITTLHNDLDAAQRLIIQLTTQVGQISADVDAGKWQSFDE